MEREQLRLSPSNRKYVTTDELKKLSMNDFHNIAMSIDCMDKSEDISEAVVDKIKKIAGSKSGITPYASGTGMNDKELAVCALYPVHGVLYVSLSNKAMDQAEARYTEGSRWYDGNGDAFRHVYWSVILTKGFNTVVGMDNLYLTAVNAATLFTNAHEFYTPAGMVRDMDLGNNQTGFRIWGSWVSYSDNAIADYIESFCDSGGAVRIDNGRLVPTTNSEKL